ncbi:MAG: tRNA uracil 4-sulfurtransferase ThiI [Candidatus Nanohalobium sp.]
MRPVTVARYGEIGTKSGRVQKNMEAVLRQRVNDKLEHEGLQPEKVYTRESRIIAEVEDNKEAANAVQLLPGIKSCSPAYQTEPDLEQVKDASEKFEYGETFGVDPHTGNTELSSRKIAEEIGEHVENFSGAGVDLDNPDTWLRVDMRNQEAYVFTEKLEGPGGFPSGTNGKYAALVSGGIDSPVAAYETMTRGADIVLVYFYNRPIAAEDHLMRFRAAAEKLKNFHPGKKWKAYRVDMEDVNKRLMEVQRGRMVMHRIIMFRVAEKIAEKEGLNGIITGESLGQKSSQTAENLQATTQSIDTPVLRPLIAMDKDSITQKAREIDTFEEAKINSACRSLSPEQPATRLKDEKLDELVSMIEEEGLAEEAWRSTDIFEV